MKQRNQLIKDEIMFLIGVSPEAMHSVGGLHDRLKDRVERREIERAVACLLGRQHIKKLGKYVFGLGTNEGITPYELKGYQPNALPLMVKTEKSPKQQIAEAENKRKQQSNGKKTMQEWSRPAANPTSQAAPQSVNASPQADKKETTQKTGTDVATPSQTASEVNYALAELEKRLTSPAQPKVQDLHTKINVLERLSLMVDPTISTVLDQIKQDLQQGEAA